MSKANYEDEIAICPPRSSKVSDRVAFCMKPRCGALIYVPAAALKFKKRWCFGCGAAYFRKNPKEIVYLPELQSNRKGSVRYGPN